MLEYHNGNIGIGTIYPQHKLDISGNINFTGNIYQGNQLYKSSQWDNNSNNIYYNIGNIGIGNSNPQYRLHVSGNTRIEGNLIVNGTETIIDTNVSTTERIDVTNDGTGPALRVTQLGTQPIADFCDETSSNVVMRIADGGNIGIGTTVPQAALDVSNNALFRRNVGIGTTVPQAALDVSNNAYFRSNIGIGTTVPQAAFDVSNNAYFRSNIGIGTSTPQAALDVSNNAYFRSNVGIGTLLPLATLDVCGNILIANNSSFQVRKNDNSVSNLINIAADNSMRFYGQGGSFHINPDSSASDTRVHQNNSNTITMYNGSNIRLIINNTGVGINKSPATNFDISGNVYINNGNVGIGTNYPLQTMDISGTTILRGNVGIGSYAPSTQFDISGNMRMTGTTLLASPISGAIEYNGTTFFGTPISTQRGVFPSMQCFVLNADRAGQGTITTAQNIFTSATNNTGGSVTLSSGTRYMFECFFIVYKTGTAFAAVQFAMIGATIATLQYTGWSYTTTPATSPFPFTYAGTNASYFQVRTTTPATLQTVTNNVTATSAATYVVKLNGYLDVTTGGAVTPSFAITAANTLNVGAGSYMVIYPVSTTGANTSIGTWA